MAEILYRSVPLPTTVEDMLSRRPAARQRTLNSYVNEIHIKLWSDYSTDPKSPGVLYRKFLDAVYDEQAVEGSTALDNAEAANVIREYARAHRELYNYVADEKKATIVRALVTVILKKYKMTRKERAIRIDENDPVLEAAAE